MSLRSGRPLISSPDFASPVQLSRLYWAHFESAVMRFQGSNVRAIEVLTARLTTA